MYAKPRRVVNSAECGPASEENHGMPFPRDKGCALPTYAYAKYSPELELAKEGSTTTKAITV